MLRCVMADGYNVTQWWMDAVLGRDMNELWQDLGTGWKKGKGNGDGLLLFGMMDVLSLFLCLFGLARHVLRWGMAYDGLVGHGGGYGFRPFTVALRCMA